MFIFDTPMDGNAHQTKKVACPNCGYHMFTVKLSNDMSSISASCNNSVCNYRTSGCSGVQAILEEPIRSIIRIEND